MSPMAQLVAPAGMLSNLPLRAHFFSIFLAWLRRRNSNQAAPRLPGVRPPAPQTIEWLAMHAQKVRDPPCHVLFSSVFLLSALCTAAKNILHYFQVVFLERRVRFYRGKTPSHAAELRVRPQVYLSSGDIPPSPAEPDAASFLPVGELAYGNSPHSI